MNRNELVHVRSHANYELWANPSTKQAYIVQRSPNGAVQFTPIEHFQPSSPPQSDRSPDPIAILGVGAAAALLIAGGAWWIGYASAPRQVQAPNAVVICQSTRESGLFWSKESTDCK
ncbi:MAG: hypothetical protein SFW36_17970 [Leptolyngbyaceae cyanobacterium bins.59]|nr:hypothetical protein [Leptolyngbyaceae cyanobacterium bins.59]